jgi:hypothetical protein
MSNTTPNIGNRDQDILYVFRDYIHFCNQEQTTLNNLLHTQNLLSNNRYSMFNLMFRHINPENSNPSPPPPTFFNNTPAFNFNTTGNGSRIGRRQPRNLRFPNRRESIWRTSRDTLNPLREFINVANTTTTEPRRVPASIRQFFENCEVFSYSQDLSNNQIRCPISMTDFSNNDICVKLPCTHIFKIRPLLQWFSRARTCPLCRRQLPNIRSTPNIRSNFNSFDPNNNNVSVQTTNLPNGFVADVSANSMEALSTALTETLTHRIQNLFQNMDPSNNLTTLLTTNIALVPQRNHRQSPINTSHNTLITQNGRLHGIDTSGNDPSNNTIIEPVD